MFTNVYSKVSINIYRMILQFNDIVEKNNIKLPNMNELQKFTEPAKTHKTTLNEYLKHNLSKGQKGEE